MRGCRHPDKLLTAWWWQNGAWRVAPSLIVIDRVTCKCGHWLRLGAARDTARTAVEVRAAELARRWEIFDGWNGFESLGMCSPDAGHAPLIERDIAAGTKYPRDLDDYYSGHLAWCIAHHDEQSKEGM